MKPVEEWINPIGNSGGLLVLLDFPSPLNWQRKVLLAGDEKRLVEQTLKGCGQDMTKVLYAYAAPYPCSKRVPTEDIPALNKDVRRIIQQNNIQKVLALGATSHAVLWGAWPGNVVDVRGRGQWYHLDLRSLFTVTSIPPFYVLKDVDYFRDFVRDCDKIVNQDKPVPEPLIDRYLVESREDLQANLEILKKASVVSLDIETTGLDPVHDMIDAIGFGGLSRDGSAFAVIIPRELVYQTYDLVKDFIFTFSGFIALHNAKFDLKFIETMIDKAEGTKTSFLHCHIRDTMLMHYLVDERRSSHESKPHGLKALSRVRYDAEDFKFDFKKFWAIPEDERDYGVLYHYLGYDLYYTAKLYVDLLEEMIDESPALLDVLNNLLMPCTLSFLEIEMYGILINGPYLDDLRGRLQGDLNVIQTKLQNILRVSSNAPSAEIDSFNINSPKQVTKMLYDHLFGALVKNLVITNRTSEQMVLEDFAKAYRHTPIGEFCEAMTEARKLSKAIGTFVDGLKRGADENGRVHTEYNLDGTGTGRLSSRNPNLQNIPIIMGTMIRKAFIAPPGYKFANADHSQLELRILAYLSKDKTMLQAYRDNRDIHKEVAASVFNVPYDEVTYEQRYAAKYLDFGPIYGRGAQAVSDAPELVDYDWTVEEAQAFIDNFLDGFPGIRTYIEDQQKFAIANQYVESATGRRRRFPLILEAGHVKRQAVNTPIQGLGSDFTQFGLIELHRLSKKPEWDTKFYVVSTVHDSIGFEIRDDSLKEVCELIKTTMETHLPVDDCIVPMKADIEIGENWADLDAWDAIEVWYHAESESFVEWPRYETLVMKDSDFTELAGPWSSIEKARKELRLDEEIVVETDSHT